MTLKDLLHGMNNVDQYDILARADWLFRNTAGRYYGGLLTESDRAVLDPPKANRAA